MTHWTSFYLEWLWGKNTVPLMSAVLYQHFKETKCICKSLMWYRPYYTGICYRWWKEMIMLTTAFPSSYNHSDLITKTTTNSEWVSMQWLTSHSTCNRSFRRWAFHAAINSTDTDNQTHSRKKTTKQTKCKLTDTIRTAHMCAYHCVQPWHTVGWLNKLYRALLDYNLSPNWHFWQNL